MEKQEEKKILYFPLKGSITFVIPKRRGEGYLKSPLGHHRSELASNLQDLPNVFVVAGDEGCISIHTDENDNPSDELTEEAKEILTAHYGFECQKVKKFSDLPFPK